MARSRNIKPAFFLNEDLSDISPMARLLFIGLWTLANRNGVLEDRPKRIKAEIFPYEDCDVNGYLTVLERLGNIQRFRVGEKGYIYIKNFKKHQHPHHTEKDNGLPLPEALKTKVEADNVNVTVKEPLTNGDTPSDSLNTDSYNIIDHPKNNEALKNNFKDFSIFWKNYPNKKAKARAEKAYQKAASKTSLAEILNGLESYKKHKPEWQDWAHPASWLNGECWNDDWNQIARAKGGAKKTL